MHGTSVSNQQSDSISLVWSSLWLLSPQGWISAHSQALEWEAFWGTQTRLWRWWCKPTSRLSSMPNDWNLAANIELHVKKTPTALVLWFVGLPSFLCEEDDGVRSWFDLVASYDTSMPNTQGEPRGLGVVTSMPWSILAMRRWEMRQGEQRVSMAWSTCNGAIKSIWSQTRDAVTSDGNLDDVNYVTSTGVAKSERHSTIENPGEAKLRRGMLRLTRVKSRLQRICRYRLRSLHVKVTERMEGSKDMRGYPMLEMQRGVGRKIQRK